jgi:hypothetical protein
MQSGSLDSTPPLTLDSFALCPWRASQPVVRAMIAEVLLNLETYLAGSAWAKSIRLLLYIYALHKHMQYVDSSSGGQCAKRNRESARGQRRLMSTGQARSESTIEINFWLMATRCNSVNAPDMRI